MDLTAAFDVLQRTADAAPEHVAEARRRRDLFNAAFSREDDVVEVVASGSLARSTQRDPINDVDVVIVFEAEPHPEWGQAGQSAADALDHLRERVRTLLGSSEGTYAQEVRLARPRNHSVKCWLDDPDEDGAFTVDVMPALRQADATLLVPEKANERWILTDPERLIREVRARQQDFPQFRPLVRTLKYWNDCNGKAMKSLTVEILALNHLPAEGGRPRALQLFFQAAVNAVMRPIEDPAGLCGEIQPDLDRAAARELLDEAAGWAWKAVAAQDAGETDRAACLWREAFGDVFPEPPGGCQKDEDDEGGGTFNIGTGAGAGAGIVGIDRPRPVTDTPQG
jgi:predicted nucleotidyltransferase